ncbi:MAG: DUF2142 domain-containing protein [Thermoleophilia bacterium]
MSSLAGMTWAMSSPLTSVPDEPAHILKAVGLYHGQLEGRRVVAKDPLDPVRPFIYYVVDVPASYARLPKINSCYYQNRNISVRCAPSPGSSMRIVRGHPSAGGYPPLYYSLVGWPSRFLSAVPGVYVMRLVSAVLCGVLFALAFAVLRGVLPLWLRLTAVTLSGTPEVWYLAGAVNPNGFEIAAAMLAWAGLIALVLRVRDGLPVTWRLCAAAGLGLVALTATRPLSPLFAGIVAVYALASAGPATVRRILRERRAVILLGVGAVAIIATGLIIVASQQLNTITGGSRLPAYYNVPIRLLMLFHVWFSQMIAVFGWLEFGPIASPVYGWLMALTVVGALVLLFGRPADAWRALGLIVITGLGPVLLQYQAIRSSGYYIWQGATSCRWRSACRSSWRWRCGQRGASRAGPASSGPSPC